MEQLVKVDKSGNFKIPQKIKNSLKLKKDESLFVFGDKNTIVIKRLKREPLKDRFKNLSGKISKRFKNEDVKKGDVLEAIEWSRK